MLWKVLVLQYQTYPASILARYSHQYWHDMNSMSNAVNEPRPILNIVNIRWESCALDQSSRYFLYWNWLFVVHSILNEENNFMNGLRSLLWINIKYRRNLEVPKRTCFLLCMLRYLWGIKLFSLRAIFQKSCVDI